MLFLLILRGLLSPLLLLLAEVTSRESPVRPSLSPFWRSVRVHPRFGIDSDKVREEERTTILTGIHLDTVRIRGPPSAKKTVAGSNSV